MVAGAHGRMVLEVELHMEVAGHVVEDIARVGDRRRVLAEVRHKEVAGMVLEEAGRMVPVPAPVVEDMGYVKHRTAVAPL